MKPPVMKSPCIKLCVLDPQSGYCIGCGRTGDEIAAWITMTDVERDAIMAGLGDRIASITRDRKRSGSKRRTSN